MLRATVLRSRSPGRRCYCIISEAPDVDRDEAATEDEEEEESRNMEAPSALELILADGCFTLFESRGGGTGGQQPTRRLERLMKLRRGPNGRYENLIDIVSDKNTLLAAYQRLRARPGLKIPLLGTKELPLSWLSEARKSLRLGGYDFQDYHARNIFRRFGARATQHKFTDRYAFLIVNLWALRTKRDEIYSGSCEFYSTKLRADPFRSFSLDFFLDYGIHTKFRHRMARPFPPVGDLIVQEAMHMTLEKIYEPLLSPQVHGYRHNRGCHSLFEEMRRESWLGVYWLLEFNFNDIFAKMDRGVLASIIQEDVDDPNFLELVLKLFNVKATIAEDVKYSPKTLAKFPELAREKQEHEELGVRRSVLAPLLCHIYLQRLDREINRMIKEQERVPVNRGRRTIFSSNLETIPKEFPINMKYVRYVDEFVVGVGASRAIVERVQSLILKFMKAELRLEPEYASYVDISCGSTLFLGMRITATDCTYDPKSDAKRLEKRQKSKFRYMALMELRERVWADRIRRLTLQSWMLGLRRERRKFPEVGKCRKLCKSMVLHKAQNMARHFAASKLKSGAPVSSVEEMLATENAVFYNMSTIGIPEEIVQAHRRVTELLDKHYRQVSKGSDEKAAVPVPKNASKRREMVQTYGALPIRLIAPIDSIVTELRYIGMIKGYSLRPDAIHSFLNAPDESIVSYFAAIAYALLVYYRCCDNYILVKRMVDFQVRWSALATLAARHDFSTRKAIHEFKRGPQVVGGRDVVASLPSTPSISRFGAMFYDNVQETMLRYIMHLCYEPRQPSHVAEIRRER